MTDSSEPDWEGLARRELRNRAERVANDVSGRIASLGHKIEDGDATPDDIRAARHALEETIAALEGRLAAATPGAEPYGGNRYATTMGEAAAMLELSEQQIREFGTGASVELTADQLRILNNGGTVVVETPGDIAVEVQPPRPEPLTHELALSEHDIKRILEGGTIEHAFDDGQCIALEKGDYDDPGSEQ